ncbi:MAG: 4a-hydroxytetrahydrobiopterin dehydratase [Acidobacteria bacterium]|nr:MAG: 4a-hydroxytetrahydrobiopterin dehydratase [Acidobacteriota bacterium]
MTLLTRQQIDEQLKTLDGWTLAGDAIKKQFTFKGFPEAVAFVNRLVPDAEDADHHPDITINYRRVTLSWSTHDEGGLTMKDVAGAKMADRHAREMT